MQKAVANSNLKCEKNASDSKSSNRIIEFKLEQTHWLLFFYWKDIIQDHGNM